jgi:predicted small lipoprotein YifL
MLKHIGILGGSAPADTNPAGHKAFGRTGNAMVGSWILGVAMLTGCGQKGPLYLPQPDHVAPKGRDAAAATPSTTPSGGVLSVPSN